MEFHYFWDNEEEISHKSPRDSFHKIEFPQSDYDLEDLIGNRSSFSQIPILTVTERIEQGNQLLNELTKIFQVISREKDR